MFIRKSSLIVFCLIASFILAGFPLTTSHADTFRPVVRGKRGVVAGGQPLSVEAGLRIFQRGGNAVDAGVATILAASVIEFSHFSFGGEVPILIKLKGQKVVVIEGMGQAPMKATREFFVNRSTANDQTPNGARARTAAAMATKLIRSVMNAPYRNTASLIVNVRSEKSGFPMIIATAISVELGDQNTGDVMFFIGLVHDVFANMLAHCRIENLLFNRGVNLQFCDRLVDDFVLFAKRCCFLETIKQCFDRIVVLQQDCNGMCFG